jgi:DNA helicase-2/ATP-dependent DNA helicase PcrA
LPIRSQTPPKQLPELASKRAAEGKFPSPRSLKEIDSEEEERRLWYVAITRAKDELYLTYPLMIVDYKRQTVIQKPSRFITEVPPALFEIWNLEEESPSLMIL